MRFSLPICLLWLACLSRGFAQDSSPAELPAAPLPDLAYHSAQVLRPAAAIDFDEDVQPRSDSDLTAFAPPPFPGEGQSRYKPGRETSEPYHWKGLLLQSFAFDLLQNSTRVITADQNDRHLLLNKPFWSDYWASLGQFNMRRWNDGDSFQVNYIGHPMQGAISGYIEIQNDPRGRSLRFAPRSEAYRHSIARAFLWETVYSTQWEIGPVGETAIFNQGGFTYPLGCRKRDLACEATAKYTNNTGWVDFVITPVVGTLLLVGEDAMDRYVTDPLVARHPGFGYKVLRSSLNPNRSLANMLRGRYPWYRDYEHPSEFESPVVSRFERALDAEPRERADLNLFYSGLSLRTGEWTCAACRTVTSGAGAEIGINVRRYVEVVLIGRAQPFNTVQFGPAQGGSLFLLNLGLRAGYSGSRAALKLSLSPGFASYQPYGTPLSGGSPASSPGRTFTFATVAGIEGDLRAGRHLAFRATLEQTVIRYKSAVRDPPGIGHPPRLSFLSHDNYVNSTNWGLRAGPVLRF